MTLPKPDWSSPDGSVALYNNDCFKVWKQLPDKAVDAVVCDPPYGINFNYATYKDTPEAWYELMLLTHAQIRKRGICAVMPACRKSELPWLYKHMPPDWLMCWYKGSTGHRASIGFSDWEAMLCYGKPPVVGVHDYFKCGVEDVNRNGHPCAKPVKWALWLVPRFALQGQTVIDPFMGSGTTGIACVRTGRRFVGCEMDPAYFKIAIAEISRELKARDTRLVKAPAMKAIGFFNKKSWKIPRPKVSESR